MLERTLSEAEVRSILVDVAPTSRSLQRHCVGDATSPSRSVLSSCFDVHV